MLKLNCFLAGKGDSFLLTWNEVCPHRLLIDAGNQNTYRFLKSMVQDFNKDDSILVTHVDYDHVGGFFKWLSDKETTFNPTSRVFMNTPQLIFAPSDSDLVGVDHGVKLEELLFSRGIKCLPLYLDQADDNTINMHGLKLQILSPKKEVIDKLISKWTANEIYQQYEQARNQIDNKVAARDELLIERNHILYNQPVPHNWETDLLNASSIAFIVEYQDYRLLFLADANPLLICEELERKGYTKEHPLEIDLFKVSHHGSKHNTTQDLLQRIKCSKYLISTDGSGPYYHPSRETLILISTYGRISNDYPITIYSNYPLPLDKLLTPEEQETLNLDFQVIQFLKFPEE
jgi:beta-lactamase superfamily II metal-dependent hydrolase